MQDSRGFVMKSWGQIEPQRDPREDPESINTPSDRPASIQPAGAPGNGRPDPTTDWAALGITPPVPYEDSEGAPPPIKNRGEDVDTPASNGNGRPIYADPRAETGQGHVSKGGLMNPNVDLASILPDVDESGAWVEDEREKDEPWRSRFCVMQCSHVDPTTSIRCGKKCRGSDRCKDHKRTCKGRNRKNGPCEAPPLRLYAGSSVDVGWCAVHCPQEIYEQIEAAEREHNPLQASQESKPGSHGASQESEHGSSSAVVYRFGTPEQASKAGKLGGQARKYPKLTEKIAEAIEAHAEDIVGAGIGALHATKPVVIERSGRDADGNRYTEQEVVEYPDHIVQLKAHEALTNRAFGRPHQAMDINQETRQLNLNIDATDPAVREDLHSFLRRRPDVGS